MGKSKSSWLDKALSKTDRSGSCWLWTGHTTAAGYGTFYPAHGIALVAHRALYELLIGEIPDGLQLDHLCRVRNCVNPAHLEPVTIKENIRRSNNFAGINARKTHCKHGHPFDDANTKVRTDAKGRTQRLCRACIKIANSKG